MLTGLQEQLTKAIDHLHDEFSKLQTGRARPELIEGVRIDAYGMKQPLKNIATCTVMDNQTLSISPFDKSLIQDISRGISMANLGLTPQDQWESILINIPPLTEDRRKDLVKVSKQMAEEARISVRNIRGDFHKKIQSAKSDEQISEDEASNLDIDLQDSIDTTNKKIDDMQKHKEEDVMKV